MSDVVGPDWVTAEWLTKVFAAKGVLRSGSVISCAEPNFTNLAVKVQIYLRS